MLPLSDYFMMLILMAMAMLMPTFAADALRYFATPCRRCFDDYAVAFAASRFFDTALFASAHTPF